MSKSSTKGVSGLDARSGKANATGSNETSSDTRETPKSTNPMPARPTKPTTNGDKNTESKEGRSANKEDEYEDVDGNLEELENRVEEMERQFIREEAEVDVPLVARPKTPTQEDVDKHNATHATYKSWCKHCVRGLAMRDKHSKRKNKSSTQKRGKFGMVDVPDTEAAVDGVTKYSFRLHAHG